jgi:hypothetical protein
MGLQLVVTWQLQWGCKLWWQSDHRVVLHVDVEATTGLHIMVVWQKVGLQDFKFRKENKIKERKKNKRKNLV